MAGSHMFHSCNCGVAGACLLVAGRHELLRVQSSFVSNFNSQCLHPNVDVDSIVLFCTGK
eukprot:6490825-Amphidinium_carterae.1